eukprot:13147534-Alexandrium_andersonii.AAC.1
MTNYVLCMIADRSPRLGRTHPAAATGVPEAEKGARPRPDIGSADAAPARGGGDPSSPRLMALKHDSG